MATSPIAGDVLGAWSGGCMAQLHPEYAPLNKWTQGFAEIFEEPENGFRLENRKIINYRLV